MALKKTPDTKSVNDVMNSYLEASSKELRAELRAELQAKMNLDDTNFSAFMVLYDALKNPRVKPRLEIFEQGREAAGAAVAYPTAIAPQAILDLLPWVSYASLLERREEFAQAASQTSLWVKKMQAGTGSTVERSDYIKKMRAGRAGESMVIGAKGTDLYVDLPGQAGGVENHSLAELQIMQLTLAQKRNEFCEIVFQDLVSTETQDSLDRIWKKPSYLDPSQTYSEKAGRRVPRFIQEKVPCIDKSYQISYNRTAPSGHWLFAVDAIRAAVDSTLRPATGCKHLVAVIGNGEDLSSTPDPSMVGWMVSQKVPIVMVTTEKTANDLKGGQIALVETADEKYVTIIEQAQAKEAGQLALFEQLGLSVKNDEQVAFFNTNMALFNYDVLVPLMEKLASEIGEKAFLDLLAPDLIMNWKEQTDADGEVRKYLQIEGAMGSSLLNLDRFWRKHYGQPLVHFINVEREHRTCFFSPIKTAFDYFMQFHSDRFELDVKTMRLSHVGAERLPQVTLKDAETNDKYYADVSTVLSNFAGLSILKLKALSVSGQITARDMKLEGRVEIVNNSGAVADVAAIVKTLTGTHELRNQKLVIDEAGRASLT